MHRRPILPTLEARRVAWWLLFVVSVVLAPAAPGDDERDPREDALARIRQQIARLESRLSEARSRETTLEEKVRRTRLELDLQEQQLAEASTAFELAAARAAAAAAKIEELESSLVHLRDDLRRRLVGLYRLGRQGYLRLFLALEPDQDLLPAIRQVRFLVRRDQALIDRYVATRDELGRERRTLEARRREMEDWRRREAERRDTLVALRRRQEALLEEVSRERRKLSEQTSELQDKQRKLLRLIRSLVDPGADPLSGTPIQEFRGVLDWPVQGKVTGRFGPRRDPRYRTEVPHNGVDIAPEGGEPEIRAVFPGQVLFADEFEGYGLMVVVHHPGRVFTLYAGLRQLSVSKGDVVSLSSLLGVGAEELYFEIRRENQAEDPLLWLR